MTQRVTITPGGQHYHTDESGHEVGSEIEYPRIEADWIEHGSARTTFPGPAGEYLLVLEKSVDYEAAGELLEHVRHDPSLLRKDIRCSACVEDAHTIVDTALRIRETDDSRGAGEQHNP